MQPEQLEEGKLYLYRGDRFRHATLRYIGTEEGFYGLGYLFEIAEDGYHVGGGYKISREGLEGIVVVDESEAAL